MFGDPNEPTPGTEGNVLKVEPDRLIFSAEAFDVTYQVDVVTDAGRYELDYTAADWFSIDKYDKYFNVTVMSSNIGLERRTDVTVKARAPSGKKL